jgi:hypothetical protein
MNTTHDVPLHAHAPEDLQQIARALGQAFLEALQPHNDDTTTEADDMVG